MPLDFIAFDNHYPTEFDVHDLADYDYDVHQYYDLRNANRRVDSFTNQINGAKLNLGDPDKRDDLAQVLQEQGLALDWKQAD